MTDIQESQNVFNTELVSIDILEQRYPQCKGKLRGKKSITLAKYLYDDNVDTSDKAVVVDWYYHTYVNDKKTLQYVKYVNDIVLYATENEITRPEKIEIDQETGIPLTVPLGESMAERGLYDHALYPFVTMSLYPIEGSVCGYGLTDIGRDTQLQIDKLNKAITDNAIAGATPRYFIKHDGTVNESEYADASKNFIHVEGNLGEENIRPVDTKGLDSIYVNFLTQKIDELKYITSNQDSNNGIVPSGVTAGSAISALQETAGKNARSSNKTFHRAYREVCYQIVELIRQFYDMPRKFRIMGENGAERYVQYSNAGILPQSQGMEMGIDMGYRLPLFDIEITAQKQSPYSKMSQNELALQFYQAGFFNPQMADQALACLDMMDFDRKHFIMQKIAQNGGMYQQMLMMQQQLLGLAQIVDKHEGTNLADQIASGIMGGASVAPISGSTNPAQKVEETEALGGKEGAKEASNTKKARQRVAESTDPT